MRAWGAEQLSGLPGSRARGSASPGEASSARARGPARQPCVPTGGTAPHANDRLHSQTRGSRTPTPDTGEGAGRKTQTPAATAPARGARRPPPRWRGAQWEAYRCRSRGPAPHCSSGARPGPEETGRRAPPRCRPAPSPWPGRREEEPQRQSSWLAQGVLERGTVVSTMAGDGGAVQRDGERASLCLSGGLCEPESSRKPFR